MHCAGFRFSRFGFIILLRIQSQKKALVEKAALQPVDKSIPGTEYMGKMPSGMTKVPQTNLWWFSQPWHYSISDVQNHHPSTHAYIEQVLYACMRVNLLIYTMVWQVPLVPLVQPWM